MARCCLGGFIGVVQVFRSLFGLPTRSANLVTLGSKGFQSMESNDGSRTKGCHGLVTLVEDLDRSPNSDDKPEPLQMVPMFSEPF